jgi:hypothetical protein
MMRKHPWFTVSVFALVALVAGCGRDGGPTATLPDDALLAEVAVDPSLSAAAGQASLPGLTMEPAATYTGSVATGNQCSYRAAQGRVVCAPVVRHGLTITRSMAFYTAAGIPQPRRNADTRSINTEIAVKGTVTTKKGSIAVDRASSLTVSGLGQGATTHTLNGSEKGTSTGTFTTEKGTVSSVETFEVETKNVVVAAGGKSTWPLSGTTTHSSSRTISRAGSPTHTSTSTETVTYNGTSVVNVTIVRDGKTSNCTRNLATGKLTCP